MTGHAHEGADVGLLEADHPARSDQGHRMVEHVHAARDDAKGEAGMDQVEGGGREAGMERIPFHEADVFQQIRLGPIARPLELPGIRVQADHLAALAAPSA